MMISPEEFITEYRNKTYKELLVLRDELLEDIRAFENHTYDHEMKMIDPAPEVVYQCNLEYLGKLCELLSQKYKQEYIWGASENETFLDVIREFLDSKGLGHSTSLTDEIQKRKEGKKYSIQDHIRGLVYSMISNQTKWYRIEPHLTEIDQLFYNYDPDEIIATNPEYFCNKIFEMKCGNIKTKEQMEALADNIRVFRKIEKKYGSIDSFVTSKPAEKIVKMISRNASPYKMKMIGPALAWEYIRNIGIDGAKPDTHLRRFFGADRMGVGKKSPATIKEVEEQVEYLSEKTGMTSVEIDNLIWSFCSDGFGAVCTATPHCINCPVREWCKQ